MVLDKLSSGIRGALDKISKALFVDDRLIAEIVKDLQRALLASDVNVRLVLDFTNTIKEKAKALKGESLNKKEQIIKIVYDELVVFLGGESKGIELEKKPYVIMLVGLFGSGKTTTAGKLARYYKKRGKKVLVVSTDTWRPAAYDQLKQLAATVDVAFAGDKKAKKPTDIIDTHEKQFKEYDLVIVDTAGRDALNDELTVEIKALAKRIKPHKNILVINADIGQAAKEQAEAFHENCGVEGVIITKLDGTAKGGGALTACSVTKAPVLFIGVGEKVDQLELFSPVGFVSRLLGMGDLDALLEKVRTELDTDKVEDLGRRLMKGDFNLIDLYEQMRSMKKMGPLSKVIELIPGFSQANLPKDALNLQEQKIEVWRHAMDSMTKEELEDPDSIRSERTLRIATGAGIKPEEVRGLLKQYKQSKKMMKVMKGNLGDEKGMEKLMKRMGGKKMRFK